GLVVVLGRYRRQGRRFAVGQQRTGCSQKKPGVGGLVPAAFLGVIEVVQPQAYDFAGAREQWRETSALGGYANAIVEGGSRQLRQIVASLDARAELHRQRAGSRKQSVMVAFVQ